MESKIVGLKDQPIESKKDEVLGFDNYVEVLTEFIMQCDTPLTIALQGDWGAGKTSLINLISEMLDEATKDRKHSSDYLIVKFNTWQYAQFTDAGLLPISLISHLISEIEKTADSRWAKSAETIKKVLAGVGRAIVVGGELVRSGTETLLRTRQMQQKH